VNRRNEGCRTQRDCSVATLASTNWQVLDVRILEGMIRHGWDGDEEARDHLFELARILDEQCTAQYLFLLESARAKARGHPISDSKRESAKTDIILKEASRRRLAGIPFDDDD